MATILVTGSTGFLGKHLVAQLLDAEPEARLRLLQRTPGASSEDPRVEVVGGDVAKRDDVTRACEGVSRIYHLAGLVERESPEPWRLYDVHVEGTRNVCEAMAAQSVEKAVFVSTSGVCAVGPDPVERDEQAPYAIEVVGAWPYYLSKIYAEKLAGWYVRHRALPIVHVNPSLLLGPGDERRSSTRDVELFLQGQILSIPVGGLNLVDARDAARGAILAMEKGRVGERYLLGGANLTFHEWILRVSKISGVRAPKIMIPAKGSLIGAAVARRAWRLAGKKFELDNASILMSTLYWYCDSAKSRAELGFTTRNTDETLRDTIAYLRKAAQ